MVITGECMFINAATYYCLGLLALPSFHSEF